MMKLTHEQAEALRQLALERGVRRVAAALAAGFPELAERAGARYAALVAHGVQRGAVHGLVDAACVARYLACWFVWGTEFETRPGFEWARAILTSPRSPQGAKAFQLCRRTQEELQRRAGAAGVPGANGLPTAADFDAALALADAELGQVGTLGSLSPSPPVPLGAACDLDLLDLRLADSGWRRRYEYVDAERQWRRVPCAPAVAHAGLGAQAEAQGADTGTGMGMPPDSLPTQVSVLSHGPGGPGIARLRIRTRARHVCDLAHHPLVRLNDRSGIEEWRGAAAAEVVLTLPAEPPEPPPAVAGQIEPALAAEGAPARRTVALSACGLRDSGAPVGTAATRIAVYPADQWLLAWQREPLPALQWPVDAAVPPTWPAPRVRLEKDGQAQDALAARWQAGLAELDRRLTESLARLPLAWERKAGVTQGRVSAETAVLAGHAGLSFGWTEGALGIAGPAWLRAQGMAELLACGIQLRCDGELALHGSASRLQLVCEGHTALRGTWERGERQPDWLEALKVAQAAFRYPFTLRIEPVACEAASMLRAAGPVEGALVGRCGLRPRPDGPGLQWFARLDLEALQVPLSVHDPLLGEQHLRHPLLPASTLLDWSLG